MEVGKKKCDVLFFGIKEDDLEEFDLLKNVTEKLKDSLRLNLQGDEIRNVFRTVSTKSKPHSILISLVS